MNYYVILGYDHKTPSISAYDNYDSAVTKFHSWFTTSMPNHTDVLGVILDEHGETMRREEWTKAAAADS